MINFGKGTALKKGPSDLRGVQSCNPLSQYAGTLKIKAERENILKACGKEQLVMESGGIEINAHVITFLIEQDPNKVAAVLDLWNAYGSMDQGKTIDIIEESVPALSSLTRMKMTGTVPKATYYDRKTGRVQIINMEKGVGQGAAESSAQFCIALNQAVIHELVMEHEELDILCVSDNITMLGDLDKVCDAIEHATTLIGGGIGGRVQAAKTTIYGKGNTHNEEAKARAINLGVKWINAEDGFDCAGAPIGSDRYRISKAEEKADAIIAEIEKITKLATSDLSNTNNTVQTMIAILRTCEASQIGFLSRILPPSIMNHAAKRIDIAIINSYTAMTKMTRLLAPIHSEELEKQIDQLFLPVRLGGLGLQSVERNLNGAYAGSIMQCGERMAEICPKIKGLAEEDQLTPSLREFQDRLEELKNQQIEAVDGIDIINVWEKSKRKMQRSINQEFQKRARDRRMEDLPSETIGRDGDKEGITKRYIMMNNEDKNAHAWILANPAIHYLKMSNDDYSMSAALHMGLNVMGSRTHCVCGEMTDTSGQHAHSCAASAVRAGQRSVLHSVIENKMRMVLNMGNKGGKHMVEINKPRVDRFLAPRTGGPNNVTSYSDIAVTSTAAQGGTTILYDVTSTDTLSEYFQEHLKKEGNPYTPGAAGLFGVKRKDQHYRKRFFTDQPVLEQVRMETLCIETTGAWDANMTRCIKEMADNITRGEYDEEQYDGTSLTEATSLKLRQITQIISVSLQAWKAQTTVRKFIKRYTLDSRPIFPYVPGSNGTIATTDPPAFTSLPMNRGRTYAMTPLTARHPLGTARQLRRM